MGTVEVVTPSPVSRATLEAKVIRADGTVEDLGVIADSGLLLQPQKPSLLQRLGNLLWKN